MPLEKLNDILRTYFAVYGEQFNSRSDIYFDEQYILVGNYPYDLMIEIDNNYNIIYSIEEVHNNKITKLIVENKEILKANVI
jgi:hypothetical protein